MPITDIFNPPNRPPTSPRASSLYARIPQIQPTPTDIGTLQRMKQYLDQRGEGGEYLANRPYQRAASSLLGGLDYAIDYPWETVKSVGEAVPDIPSMVRGWLGETYRSASTDPALQRYDFEPESAGQKRQSGAAFDLASMVPAAGLLATRPSGSIGMFAGRRAKTADNEALAKAMSMKSQGAGRDAIWGETGWFKGADDKWRFEIDDSAMRVDEFPGDIGRGQGYSGPQSLIQHPEISEAYPRMSATQHSLVPEGSGGYLQAGTNAGATQYPPQMVARGKPDKLRSTVLHEGQHDVQGQEGFAVGGDYHDFVPDVRSELAILGDEVKNINSRMREVSGTLEYEGLMGVRSNVVKRIQALEGKYGDPREYAYEQYKRLAGEAESRNVQARRDFTPEQRIAQPPWQTLDVPEEELIVRMRGR